MPKGILSFDKMEKLLWEQTKADAFTQEFISKDSSKDLTVENFKLQEKIFAKYKVDRKTFYISYEYYLKHEDLMKPLLDTIVVRNGRARDDERIKNILKPDNEQIKY
ncbi:MAG: DUF4296 domain-containing protein [Ferruginibacter sp.]|nr:DUF4296 domain-containing protein [Ferruginibacter sp.]